jgi:hypothetical protein
VEKVANNGTTGEKIKTTVYDSSCVLMKGTKVKHALKVLELLPNELRYGVTVRKKVLDNDIISKYPYYYNKHLTSKEYWSKDDEDNVRLSLKTLQPVRSVK